MPGTDRGAGAGAAGSARLPDPFPDVDMKILIVGFLVLIIASLGSALFYLFNDKGNSTRTVRALTLRVGLSVVLFLLLMLAHFTGVITLRGSAL
jgi:hypothetical protein